MKEQVNEMMRALTVLVKQSKYIPKTGKIFSKYENINVLVGPKAHCDIVKEKLDNFLSKVGGSFERNDRIQAM